MSDAPRRVNYFAGRLLTADDLRTDQEYHRRMRFLHNRLHGYGVVDGLDVSVDGDRLHVSPGLAIDVLGREIVLSHRRCLDLVELPARGNGLHVLIAWAEEPEGNLPGPDGTEANGSWVEEPQVTLASPTDAASEALVLAVLKRRRRGSVSLDLSVRRPLGA